MTSHRDILLFVGLALVWGTSFAAIEVGLETLPPILFAAMRFDVAALLFAGGVLALGLEWRPQTAADRALIAVGAGLVVGAHFALLFLGQSYVTSGVAAIVLSLIPILTPPLALALVPSERIRAPAVVGVGLGLVGVVVIATSGGAMGGQVLGVGLLFASALTFALGSVLTERLTPRATLPLISMQAWAMAGGALLLHAISAAHPAESLTGVDPTAGALLALAYLGVVATAGGFLAFYVLLERVGATELSLVNYAVPLVAAVVGWAALGETITVATLAGFALILLGFALCKIGALWRHAAPVVGYGPVRPTLSGDGVVVAGNVYVSGEETGQPSSSVLSAD